MLYRRKKRDPETGKMIEMGPWWIKYYDDGKPIWESTRKREKREALMVLRKAEAKVADGQREGPAVKRTRFDDLIENLKSDYVLKRRKTWNLREQHLAHLKPVFGGMRVTAITTPKLQAYAGKRLDEGAAPGTVNRELDCLHRMMILGQRQTPPKVLHVPHFPRLAEDNVREGFCEHDSYLCIRGAAPYHIQVAATVGYYTGMRKAEILGLRWDNQMDMDQNCIRLERKQTKTKTPRVVYMTGEFLMVMLKAKELRDRDYPYCPWVVHIKGKRVLSFDHGWKALMKRLGLEGVLFHDLRRTGVRNLVRAGVPETVAMKISGHRTRSVFDRYNITSEEDLRAAAERLEGYIQQKKVTDTVTVAQLSDEMLNESALEPIENMAERVGFEPTVQFPRQQFSRLPDSATLAPLRCVALFVHRYSLNEFRKAECRRM
jgi:integrase